MMSYRIALRYLWALTLPTVAHAQAAVEYAAKSATSALSGGARQAHLGVCPLDSTLVPCVKPALFAFCYGLSCTLGAAFERLPTVAIQRFTNLFLTIKTIATTSSCPVVARLPHYALDTTAALPG
jgi:hypothetical protein